MSNKYGNDRRRAAPSINSSAPSRTSPPPMTEEPTSLAMVYAISQRWEGINDTECGFERGTLFDALDMPFCGDKCRK